MSTLMRRKTSKKGFMVRIEEDVGKSVKKNRVKNGRTIQGEVNVVLRQSYQGIPTLLAK